MFKIIKTFGETLNFLKGSNVKRSTPMVKILPPAVKLSLKSKFFLFFFRGGGGAGGGGGGE